MDEAYPDASSPARTATLAALAMLAFAGNSLLCRLALKGTSIDAATFTFVRIASAALVLWLILAARGGDARRAGSWASAAMLTLYAAAFSYAYVALSAGAGALLLFGAVQATMIGYGLFRGEHLTARQWLGLTLALAGLVWLVLPGLAAPQPLSSALMLVAGVGWGVYSLRGRGLADPTAATAGNFLRAFPIVAAVFALAYRHATFDAAGFGYALASGALDVGTRIHHLVCGAEEARTRDRRDRATERAGPCGSGRRRAARRGAYGPARRQFGGDSRRYRARHRQSPKTLE